MAQDAEVEGDERRVGFAKEAGVVSACAQWDAAEGKLPYEFVEDLSESGASSSECGQGYSPSSNSARRPVSPPRPRPIPCTAGGRRPVPSNFDHCPTPQSFVRCGPHHRSELCVLDQEDMDRLYDLWYRYKDDLTWPWYEKKPRFSDEDFTTFFSIAQKVVNAMVEEYQQPMVLDQATISNTNHVGHPPHADNVQFDSVWWKGKRIRSEDEVVAAQEGAYVLWRSEKTSYRSYGCTVALSDPAGYEGGEVQFFSKWGDKTPVVRYKCAPGFGVAFCGCQQNIHAVTGVKSGFRLVLLVWTRPPDVRVPESQLHVCYFRPGTGHGVWLTTADIQKGLARKRGGMVWLPKEEDDESCNCPKCLEERRKLAWKDCANLTSLAGEPRSQGAPTPTTSAGNSPRTATSGEESDAATSTASHCPHRQGRVLCDPHGRVELPDVIAEADAQQLMKIWEEHKDDLSKPWYDEKPSFTQPQFEAFRTIAQKVVDAMAKQLGQPLVLDQATVSKTNHIGHSPHADNVQFDSVWWRGRQIKQRDELAAARGGAEVLWKEAKTNYRNYSASVALTDPSEYGGGDLEFYSAWGEKEPEVKYRNSVGTGVAYCGCQRSLHAVAGVKWGWCLVLLVWTRPPDVPVPEDQKHVCYFRPGTGLAVWLTTADLENYPKRRRRFKNGASASVRDEASNDGTERREEAAEGH